MMMGQYWKLFNIDKKESLSSVTISEVFYSERFYQQLLSLLTRPTATSVILEEIEGFIGFKSQTGTLSEIHHDRDHFSCSPLTLDMLPSDIILIIFSMLSDIEDVTMFALTCSTFWITGKKRLCAVRDQHTILWSGCRIACFGDYAKKAPPGMLTDADREELKAYATTTVNFLDASLRDLHDSHHEESSSDTASNSSDEFWDDELLRSDFLRNNKPMLFKFLDETSTTRMDPSLEGWRFNVHGIERRVLNALCDRPPLLSPVLLNLTKREYICDDKDAQEKIGNDDIMLGQVLLARICWSSEPTKTMIYEGELPVHEGEWAGDQLDCVEFQDFEKDLSGQSDDHDREQRPWKDITKEAWGLLARIYYGCAL